MKRIIAFFCILAFCLVCVSCEDKQTATTEPSQSQSGTKTPDATSEKPTTVDLADLKASMTEKFGATDFIDIASDMLLNLYGIAAEDIADSACYTTMDSVFPQEVIMIKATNEDAKERIVVALEKRIDEVKEQSKNYDAENYALAQKCTVGTEGMYVTMFLSPHYDTMTEMFQNAFSN